MADDIATLQRKVAIKRRLAEMGAADAPDGAGTTESYGQRMLSNAYPSAVNLVKNTVQPILHPIDTAQALGTLGRGAYKNVAGGYAPNDPDVVAADAIGAMYKRNYGSLEGFKEYAAEDPFGALSDAMTVAALGAGAVGKGASIAGKLSKTGGTAAKVANAVGAAAGKAGAVASALDPSVMLMRAPRGIVKGAGYGVRGAGHLIDTVGGDAKKISARIIADRVGANHLDDVTTALGRTSDVDDFNRTASQAAAGVPGQTAIEASERQISRIAGNPSGDMNRRLGEQAAALDAAMSVHAKTPEALDAAFASRAAKTAPLYDAARNSTARVDVSAVQSLAKEIIGDNAKQTKITQPVADVVRSISEAGPAKYKGRGGRAFAISDAPKGLSVKDAMSARKQIRDLIDKRDSAAFPEYDRKALTQLDAKLEAAIEASSDTYKKANELYKTMSGPVNKMQIAQEIRSRLTNAKDLDSFNLALTDFANEARFIEKVTGFSGNKTFADIFDARELKQIYAVRDEMQNSFLANNPRQRTSVNALSGEIPLEKGFGLNLLSREVALANWVAKKIGRDVEPKVIAEMMRLHLSPDQMVNAIKKGGKAPVTSRIEAQLDRVPVKALGPVLYQTGKATNPLVIDIKNREKEKVQ